MNERGPSDCIFDKNTPRAPLLGKALYGRLERRIVDRRRQTSRRYQRFLRVRIQVVQTDQSLSGPPLLAVSQLCSVISRSA